MPLKLPSKTEILMAANPQYESLCRVIQANVETYKQRLAKGETVYVSTELIDRSVIGFVVYEIGAYHPDYDVQVDYQRNRMALRLK